MTTRHASTSFLPLVRIVSVISLAAACSSSAGDGSVAQETSTTVRDIIGADTSAPGDDVDLTRSGGDATVDEVGPMAFALGIETLDREQRRAFAVGNNFFNDNWVAAPASTEGRDGLGPLLNAQSCSSCHLHDGRAKPPSSPDDPERGLLLRLSIVDDEGNVVPEPVYGGQLQDRSILGIDAEGKVVITWTTITGEFDDGSTYQLMSPTYSIDDLAYGPLADGVMISPRIAPAVFGVGLLEAIPAETIEALQDPDDADGDGISGRVNRVLGPDGTEEIGRFGWKASVATVRQQNAGAFNGDIGITTNVEPGESCTARQTACLDAPTGGTPEVDDDKLDRVTFYTRTLAVPARRDVGEPDTDAGSALFESIGCATCHVPELRTGDAELPALADQTIRPYTDLLLHDMGEGLADHRPDGAATGTEWRTAPLWGIGLVDDVNRHTRFLHDGRARSLTEAILWHGGEAESSQQGFVALTATQRRQLIAFLESL
jgi:CxxC motif-containing protein (DUF1111 family)